MSASYPSPWDCPCGAPRVLTPLDRDEGGGVLEECVAGCPPMRALADVRDIPAVVAEVKDMHRKGEI
jgi:hypothetical protein